jgi:2-polyprenyl-6-methoxyphenol hydroxylase-like FAD-dependent oxidoreductase
MSPTQASQDGVHRESATCCIAGCGPAGAVLGLLQARAGVEVLVLEKHEDFFRDFRGDTIHPSTLDVIEELGLFEEFSAVPQRRVSELRFVTDGGTATFADLRELGIRHPYIAFVPQWDFLDFLTDEARRYPTFTLRMGAEVTEVVRREGEVRGVRYRSADGVHEVAATLTVAADGRDSVLRRSAGLAPRRYGAPMDVLWFRLTRRDGEPEARSGYWPRPVHGDDRPRDLLAGGLPDS